MTIPPNINSTCHCLLAEILTPRSDQPNVMEHLSELLILKLPCCSHWNLSMLPVFSNYKTLGVLPVIDTIHPQSNKFVTGVNIKTTGDTT